MIAQPQPQPQAQQARTTWQRNWTFPRHLLERYAELTAFLGLAMLVITTVVSFGINYWGTVESSTWDDAANSAPQWFLAILTGYIAHKILPAMVATGRTRREVGMQVVIFSLVYSVALALFAVIGFLLEKGLFSAMDWNQAVASDRLFGSSTDVHRIFTEMVFTLLVWSVAGAVIGAGFYRSDEAGWGVLGIAWIPVLLVEYLLGTQSGDPLLVNRIVDLSSLNPFPALATSAVVYLALIALFWRVIRDLPLRSLSN